VGLPKAFWKPGPRAAFLPSRLRQWYVPDAVRLAIAAPYGSDPGFFLPDFPGGFLDWQEFLPLVLAGFSNMAWFCLFEWCLLAPGFWHWVFGFLAFFESRVPPVLPVIITQAP